MKPDVKKSAGKMQISDIKTLIRPNILALTPYRSARDDFKSGILLDANENSFGSALGDTELNRYPDPRQENLRSSIAGFRNVNPGQIFLGVGSDEPIDLLLRIFCRPGMDRILITPPTYGMYKVSAGINDVGVEQAPLNPDFSLNSESIFEKLDEVLQKTGILPKMLFLCSPNNPTANSFDRNLMIEIIETFRGIVVVDEAYIDFSSAGSLLSELNNYANLVVLQTMSKAFGMAAIRLGMAFAHPEIIDTMNRVKAPYNINNLTANAGIEAIRKSDVVKTHIREILQERERLVESLGRMPKVRQIFPSDANFILMKLDGALEIYRKLAQKGIIVRYRGDQIHCDDCLRITVGTSEENRKLIYALEEVLS